MSSIKPENGNAALQAIVFGRVQGVYFRAFVNRVAVELKLCGWVCNEHDGSVWVYAEGNKANLEELVKNLKLGPPGARVDSIDLSWVDPAGKYRDFSVTG